MKISPNNRPAISNPPEFRPLWFALLLLASSLCYSAVAQDTQHKLVEASFERYRQAIMSAQADAAYAEINEKTRQYYVDMLDKVMYLSAAETSSLTVLEKIFIAQSRHRIAPETLQQFDGEKYFKYAVEQGWIGKDSVANASLGNISVSGDSATSQFIKQDKTLPFGFSFSREQGDWKIDLVSILPVSNLALQHMINNAEADEQSIIFQIVETLSGEPVDESVWNPPFSRE